MDRTRDRRTRAIVALLVVAGAALMAALPSLAAAPARAAPASGALLWARTYGATGNHEEFYGCAKGPSGGLYVAGVQNAVWGVSGDLVVCKYARSGSRRWAVTWVSPLFVPSHGTEVAVDRHGNIVVAGEVSNPGGSDWLVTKWDPAGTLLWGVTFDGPANSTDELIDLVLDRYGCPYACGYVTVPGGTAMLTVKFRSGTGAVAWQSMYAGPGANDGATTIAVDSARNTYMAGWSVGPGGDSDGVIVKTDAAGNRTWVRRQEAGTNLENDWNGLRLQDGVLYAGGDRGTDPARDVIVGAYTTGNHRKWVRTWDDFNHFSDWGDGMALDAAGDLFVCGTIDNGGAPHQSAFLVKWNTHGARQWDRSYKNGARYANYDDVVADAYGNAWVVGTVDTATRHDDALVVNYAADGTRRWLRKWDGAGGEDSLWTGMLSGSTSLYAVGQADWPPGDHRGLVLKYRR
jgi:hypothetical protein